MLQPISLFPFLKIIIIIISSSILKKTMKLYYFPLSQPSRSVLLLIKEAKIDCEVITVDLMKGEHKKPEYLAVNPLGLVPSIVDDDGFVLCESGAILTYLAESRSLTEWLPIDPKVRGRVNYWLHWNHSGTRLSTLKLLRPAFHGAAITEEDRKCFSSAIQHLDSQLTPGKFVAGTTSPTIADLLLLPELDQLEVAGLFDYTPYGNVVAYMASLRLVLVSYEANIAPVRKVFEAAMKK